MKIIKQIRRIKQIQRIKFATLLAIATISCAGFLQADTPTKSINTSEVADSKPTKKRLTKEERLAKARKEKAIIKNKRQVASNSMPDKNRFDSTTNKDKWGRGLPGNYNDF